MTIFDQNDMDVAKTLGGIEAGVKSIHEQLTQMNTRWNDRIVQRDKERKEFNDRLISLEQARANAEGSINVFKWLASIGFIGFILTALKWLARL